MFYSIQLPVYKELFISMGSIMNVGSLNQSGSSFQPPCVRQSNQLIPNRSQISVSMASPHWVQSRCRDPSHLRNHGRHTSFPMVPFQTEPNSSRRDFMGKNCLLSLSLFLSLSRKSCLTLWCCISRLSLKHMKHCDIRLLTLIPKQTTGAQWLLALQMKTNTGSEAIAISKQVWKKRFFFQQSSCMIYIDWQSTVCVGSGRLCWNLYLDPVYISQQRLTITLSLFSFCVNVSVF